MHTRQIDRYNATLPLISLENRQSGLRTGKSTMKGGSAVHSNTVGQPLNSDAIANF